MYGCESWTIKKAEPQRIDAFELWCWRRLLRVPWTVRRSNQSVLKEINPEYSLEGLMLKMKLQYCGHLMWRSYSLEKTLMLGKIEGGRRRRWQRMVGWHHRLDGQEFEQTPGDEGQGRTGKPGVLQSMGLQRVRHDWATELNLARYLRMKKYISPSWCSKLAWHRVPHWLFSKLESKVKYNMDIKMIILRQPRFFSWLHLDPVQFSHSVMSDSLQAHGLKHARPPCPSPTPGAYSNSWP